MRGGDAAKAMFAGCIVYVVMAACGGSKGAPGFASKDGGGSIGDGSSSGSGPGGDNDSDLVDALTNPVPDANAEPTTSGSRLKARYYVGEDGSRQFVGWYDSQRKEECSFLSAGDGETRCLPAGAYPIGVYSDANCTTPIVYV